MRTLRLFVGAVLLSTAPTLWADEPPHAAPFEVGQWVEITLAKPYFTTGGVRIEVPWGELAGKEMLTLVAGGHERSLPLLAARGRVQGLLTAVDDGWLTLDPGEQRPLLRVPRAAVVRWSTLGSATQGAELRLTAPRTRVASTELGRLTFTGHLLAIDKETLLVKVAGRAEPIRLRRSSIEQIQVSRGEHGRAGKGALIGAAVVGIPLAIVVGLNGGPLLEGRRRVSLRPFWDGLSGGAILGAPVGALIGSASRSERWERLSLSVGVAPRPRRGVAALTLRF
jgi:hypothetical protein